MDHRMPALLMSRPALLAVFAMCLFAQSGGEISWRLSGPGGGGWIQSIVWDPRDKDVLYVGCDVGGFYFSSDAGRSYQIRNLGLHDYFVEAIAVHSRKRGIILLGTESGIHRTTDAGLHWQWVRNGFPKLETYRYSAPIGALRFDPQQPDTAYAGIGRPRWGNTKPGASDNAGVILRSDDAGLTWRRTDGGAFPARTIVSDIAIQPGNSRTILAATTEGVFRSDDQGAHWNPSCNGLPHGNTERLAFAPSDPQIVYLTLRSTAAQGEAWNGGIYRSEDAGRTWQPANGEGLPRHALDRPGNPLNLSSNPKEIAVDPRDANVVYLGHRDWVTAGIYKTTDGGRHWSAAFRRTKENSNIEYGWIREWGPSVESLALSPAAPDRLAFGTSGHVFVSDDGARTWQQRYSASSDDTRLAGAGLETTCLWRLVADPLRRGRVYYAYMDIGLLITDDEGRTFRRSSQGMKTGGNCFAVTVDPDALKTFWAATGWWNRNAGDVCRTDDDGRTWRVVGRPESGLPDARVVEIVLDRKSPVGRRRLLALSSGYGVYQTLDGGESWHATNGNLSAGDIADTRGLLLDPADSRHAILATPHKLYETRDGGTDWQALGMADEPFQITRLIADPRRFRTLYLASRQGYDSQRRRTLHGGAFRSDDGGSTWRQILNCPYAADIAASPADENVLYVATKLDPYFDGPIAEGLLRSGDRGRTWQAENTGLSNLNIKTIAISPLDPSTIFIGSAGNSAFVGKDHAVRTSTSF